MTEPLSLAMQICLRSMAGDFVPYAEYSQVRITYATKRALLERELIRPSGMPIGGYSLTDKGREAFEEIKARRAA